MCTIVCPQTSDLTLFRLPARSYVHFKNDKPFMRWFVFVLMLADTANALLDLIFIYQYLITHFGNYDYASVANPAFASDPVMTGIIAFATQIFFAWRVYKLMHSKIMPSLIVVGATISLLSALGTTIGVTIVGKFVEFQKFQVAVILWLVGAAVTDVIITGSLVWTLNKARTGFAATDDVITKLIRMTLQTGMLTSAFAVIDIILFLASTTTLHLVFNLPLAKLYVNSLLSTLNARVIMNSTSSGGQYTFDGNHSDAQHRRTGKRSAAFLQNTSRPGMFKSHSSSMNDAEVGMQGFGAAQELETGIHIKTVEETFEERHELEQTRHFAGSSSDSVRVTEKRDGDSL